MSHFFRFPHTPHIAWLQSGSPRDDKVLTADEIEQLLSGPVVVEEKLDGANLGFSITSEGHLRAQNRGAYLHAPYTGQFSRLEQWIAQHEDRFFDAIGEELILFGEWCAARHSLDYQCLPDWWLLFDVYDRNEQRFWSTTRRNALAERLQLATVPALLQQQVTVDSLKTLVATQDSRYRSGPLEGVVIRRQDENWLIARGKLVRAEFTQAIESHWRNRAIEWNRVDFSIADGATADEDSSNKNSY